MNKLESTNVEGLFIDIGQSSLKAVNNGETFEFPIERGEDGRLTALCRERLTAGLRGFLSKKGRATKQNAWCTIGARGVSMRRMTLPAASKEEFQRVLRLKIESEFPLAPDELAWSWLSVGPPKASSNDSSAQQEVLVVAVKKEVPAEYADLFAAFGVTPRFTLATLARTKLHPPPIDSCAVLDIGRTHSELLTFEKGLPASIRLVPWGGETITRSIQDKLGVSHDEAEKLKLASDQPGAGTGAQALLVQSAKESALAILARLIKPASSGGRFYLTGKCMRDRRIPPRLTELLGGTASCESLEPANSTGNSATIAGLMKSAGGNSATPLLMLEMAEGQGAVKSAGNLMLRKWAAAAVLLTLGALFFPYVEAIVLKPFMERKLASLQADRGRLAMIDQELEFLKFLKQNQPPYLDAIYLLAKCAPQGTRLDSLSMGRHQEISIRLKTGSAQQVSDFRSKLIDSGWFNNVVVEEQTPSPDRRVTVRMTAELRPVEARKPLAPEPPAKKTDTMFAGGDDSGMMTPPTEPVMMTPPQPVVIPVEANPTPPPDGQDTPPPRRGGRRGGVPQPVIDQ